jgi:hypothetical protein
VDALREWLKAMTFLPRGEARTRLAVLGFVAVWFVAFTWRALYAHFTPDDMMNIYYPWSRGPWKLAVALVLFPSTYYRPMGSLFYAVLYHFFGLNPLPYHAALLVLLLLNMVLAWRVARLLTGSDLVAGFTALFTCYHPMLIWLDYHCGFVYDALCFTFFFAALNVYLTARQSGKSLTLRRLLAFLLLYVGALDSKEMAVTLPVVVLAYELLRWGRKARPAPALIAAAMTAVYIYGKTHGPDTLIRFAEYRPVFTWYRFLESNAWYLGDFFCYLGSFSSWQLLLLWAVLLVVVLRVRKPHLMWAWVFVVVTPLPIAFLTLRGEAMLCIPLFGWALMAASLIVTTAEWIASDTVFRGRAQAFVRTAVFVVVLGLVASFMNHETGYLGHTIPANEGKVPYSIQQVETLQPHLPPHSSAIFLNDLFPSWTMYFIAELVWRDHTLQVYLQHETPKTQAEIEKMDYVFQWTDHRLVRVTNNAVH